MMTITLGRWQVAALAVSLFVLVVAAVLLGFLLASSALGVGAGAVPPASASASASGVPSQGAAGAGGGDLAAKARQRLAHNFEAKRAVIDAADEAGDAVRDGNDMLVDPVVHGASAAAQRFLPKWMGGGVASTINRAAFRAKQKVAYGVEDRVEDALNGAISGGDGGPAPAPTPPRVYAIELGRFATSFNAESFAAAAARRGVSATVDYAPEAGQSAAYAVRTGRYAAADQASAALEALSRSAGVAGTVVTLAEAGARPAP